MLFEQIQTACDLEARGVRGGHFDGPLAYRMACAVLFPEKRTERDKAYYKTAEKFQIEHPLQDGASADAYERRAMAWIIKIKPYLAQKYEEEDAADYIINQMPPTLRAVHFERLKDKLAGSGTLGNLVEVMKAHAASSCSKSRLQANRMPQWCRWSRKPLANSRAYWSSSPTRQASRL